MWDRSSCDSYSRRASTPDWPEGGNIYRTLDRSVEGSTCRNRRRELARPRSVPEVPLEDCPLRLPSASTSSRRRRAPIVDLPNSALSGVGCAALEHAIAWPGKRALIRADAPIRRIGTQQAPAARPARRGRGAEDRRRGAGRRRRPKAFLRDRARRAGQSGVGSRRHLRRTGTRDVDPFPRRQPDRAGEPHRRRPAVRPMMRTRGWW